MERQQHPTESSEGAGVSFLTVLIARRWLRRTRRYLRRCLDAGIDEIDDFLLEVLSRFPNFTPDEHKKETCYIKHINSNRYLKINRGELRACELQNGDDQFDFHYIKYTVKHPQDNSLRVVYVFHKPLNDYTTSCVSVVGSKKVRLQNVGNAAVDQALSMADCRYFFYTRMGTYERFESTRHPGCYLASRKGRVFLKKVQNRRGVQDDPEIQFQLFRQSEETDEVGSSTFLEQCPLQQHQQEVIEDVFNQKFVQQEFQEGQQMKCSFSDVVQCVMEDMTNGKHAKDELTASRCESENDDASVDGKDFEVTICNGDNDGQQQEERGFRK